MNRVTYFIDVLRKLRSTGRPPTGRLMVMAAMAELSGGDGRGWIPTNLIQRRIGIKIENTASVLQAAESIGAVERTRTADQPDLVRLSELGAVELAEYLNPKFPAA